MNGGGTIVNATGPGIGGWERFYITVGTNPLPPPEPASSSFVWIDVDNDGTRDQIAQPGSSQFMTYMSNWYTECYDYWWYSVNDQFDPWGYTWGGDWYDTPGFSRMWLPDMFWWYGSSYSYCDTHVELSVDFETEAGHRYSLYEDTSGSAGYNPSNWTPVFINAVFGDGMQSFSLGWFNADYARSSQYFLVRHGGPPTGVLPENDYSWHWEELPHYPASRRWDGVTIESDFPQWNWQNWPDNWFMASPEDDDPALDALFGYTNASRVLHETAADLRTVQKLQRVGHIQKISRGAIMAAPVGLMIGIFVQAEKERTDRTRPWSYVVYEKLQPSTGRVYTGRTMGPGDAITVMNRRDAAHLIMNEPLRPDRFDPAVPSGYVTLVGSFSSFGYSLMRGREQQVMDYHGGALSERGYSYNVPGYGGRTRATNWIRGVSKDKKGGYIFWATSTLHYGQVWDFTGYTIFGSSAPLDRVLLNGPVSYFPFFYPY